jgi:hypothetical protein
VALALAIPVLATILGAGCAGRREADGDSVVATKRIEDVLAAHTDSLMAIRGVVGTAIGLCDRAPCIRVFVVDSTVARRGSIPDRLEGFPVRTEVSGSLRPRRDTTESQ